MGHDMDDATYKSQVRSVWVATGILSAITIVEVAIALWWYYNMPEDSGKMVINSLMIIMSILKAYFIVAEFMHVKYETRALALTILGPAFFLIWFIIAFLWEGGAWLNLREVWGVVGG